MADINLHTTLGFAPRPCKHPIICITRGATASINFDLTLKVYRITNMDQFTYLFKQGKNIYSYNMIKYFVQSEDEDWIEGKQYYRRKDDEKSYSTYRFEPMEKDPRFVPKDGFFEDYELPEGVETENWEFDDHFEYVETTNFAFINFMFRSEETKQFKPTTPDCNVKCEVVIRLNTDAYEGMHNFDSVIVEEQHPIAIVDSIFSKLE